MAHHASQSARASERAMAAERTVNFIGCRCTANWRLVMSAPARTQSIATSADRRFSRHGICRVTATVILGEERSDVGSNWNDPDSWRL